MLMPRCLEMADSCHGWHSYRRMNLKFCEFSSIIRSATQMKNYDIYS